MNLEQLNNEQWHERYLLNRLSKKERQAYEAFIETHPEAKKQLSETRLFIQAVQQEGTADIKAELQRQINAKNSYSFSMQSLYQAAALLFVFIGLPLLIYFQYNKTEVRTIAEHQTDNSFKEEPTLVKKAPLQQAERAALNKAPVQPKTESKNSVPIKKEQAKAKKPAAKELTSTNTINKQNTSRRSKTIEERPSQTDLNQAKVERELELEQPANRNLTKSNTFQSQRSFSSAQGPLQQMNMDINQKLIFTSDTMRISFLLDKSLPSAPDTLLFSLIELEDVSEITISVPKAYYQLNRSAIRVANKPNIGFTIKVGTFSYSAKTGTRMLIKEK